MKSSKVNSAYNFAKEKHEGQKRKYTGEPYIVHPCEVAKIVSTVPHTENMLCAALMHDCLEDTECGYEEIGHNFGFEVADLVLDLTDVSMIWQGNRKTRKEIDRQHTKQASPEAKTIKLADLISNTKSICEHDKDFAKVYVKEKELLLQVLTEGDPILYKQAYHLMLKCKEELGIV